MMTINSKKLGLYIHIPFCVQKCRYCGFLSFDRAGQDLHSAYVKALIEEMSRWVVAAKEHRVDTIFLGGGTPSLLPGESIVEILEACRTHFSVADGAEITMESNPGTLSREKMDLCFAAGVNRLSIGVQSLNGEILSFLGRIHTTEEAVQSYFEAREAGFSNINLDFMFGIPGQTQIQWEETINRALSLSPEHLSFYGLQIEENTVFYDLLKKGELKETEDVTDRRMYHYAIEKLKENGYVHYEISNAAKPDFFCRHNMKYWSMEEYIGLGLGAHSWFNGFRSSNETNLEAYLNGAKAVWVHKNTEKDTISEYVFTGLRLMEGLSRVAFCHRFGVSMDELFETEIQGHLKNGLLEESEDGDRIRLTSPGMDLSNRVMADFV